MNMQWTPGYVLVGVGACGAVWGGRHAAVVEVLGRNYLPGILFTEFLSFCNFSHALCLFLPLPFISFLIFFFLVYNIYHYYKQISA